MQAHACPPNSYCVLRPSAIPVQKPLTRRARFFLPMVNCQFLCGRNAFSMWTGCICHVDRHCKCRHSFMDMAALFIQMAAFISCNAAISRQWSWSQVFWSRREARLDGQEGHFVHEKIFKSLQDSKTPSSESNGREVLVTWLMRIPYGSWGGCEGCSWKTNKLLHGFIRTARGIYDILDRK